MKRILLFLMLLSALPDQLVASCKTHKITQKDIPYPITKPGKYILCEDIAYDYSPSDGIGAAIRIETSNVQLCLFAHSITVNDIGSSSNAVGILVNDRNGSRISEIDINNDAITGTTNSLATGIKIENAHKVRLDNMFTVGDNFGLATGLSIINASEVFVEACEFSSNMNGFGCKVTAPTPAQSSDSLTFSHTTFSNTSVGLSLEGCKDTKIYACSFPDSQTQNLITTGTNGLLIKDSSFTRTSFASDLVFLVGNDTRIEGCSFIAKAFGRYGVNFNKGTGLIIDSCLFDLVTDATVPTIFANILLGVNTSNVFVTQSTLQGTGTRRGIEAAGTNTRIQDCLIRLMNRNAAVFISGSGCTVDTCSLVQNGVGVAIGGSPTNIAATSSNSIINCTLSLNTILGISIANSQESTIIGNTITENTNIGISINGTQAPSVTAPIKNTISDNTVANNGLGGISIGNGSVQNIFQRNRVYGHTGFGIQDANPGTPTIDTANKFYENVAFNNLLNYSPVIPTQLIPGIPTVEGANIKA